MAESTELQKEPLDPNLEIRKQFRIIGITTLLLLLVLIGAMAIHLVVPPLSYSLFCIIFVIDFGRNAALIWIHKIFWWTAKRATQGNAARVIAGVYGLLSLVMLVFAIFFLVR